MLHNHDLVICELLEIAPICHSEGFIIAVLYLFGMLSFTFLYKMKKKVWKKKKTVTAL